MNNYQKNIKKTPLKIQKESTSLIKQNRKTERSFKEQKV